MEAGAEAEAIIVIERDVVAEVIHVPSSKLAGRKDDNFSRGV